MWYPSQQQQYSCYGYMRHHSSQQQQQQQQQQTYSRTSYYCNTDELSTTCVGEAINDENESPYHCQTTYSGNAHVTTPNYYVTTSLNPYGDEMSSYQTAPTRKALWNPAIVAPTRNTNMNIPSVPIASPVSPAPTSACWHWVLFSPQHYSELYTPLSACVQQSMSNEEEARENEDEHRGLHFLASLPTCLLALLYLTPELIGTSDDENENDHELGSLHSADGSSLPIGQLETKSSTLSSVKSANSKSNRSSTPDTDDGYQSASDASRSDYSQQSSLPYNHHLHHSKEDILTPTPLMPRRISYAAAAKPTMATKVASLPAASGKSKQTINKTLSTISATNDLATTNGQKLKFIAPRFERMHHAKQHASPATSIVKTLSSSASNRTQPRSTNTNNNQQQQQAQRHYPINSTRRR